MHVGLLFFVLVCVPWFSSSSRGIGNPGTRLYDVVPKDFPENPFWH